MKTFIGHANQFAGQFDFENKPGVMWQTYPTPTAPPSDYGLTSYIPMSSSTDPRAANYQIPMSSQSGELNAYGNPLYAGSALQSGGWYVNPATGQSTQYWAPGTQPTAPQPGPAPQSTGLKLSDVGNPAEGTTFDWGGNTYKVVNGQIQNLGSSAERAAQAQRDLASQISDAYQPQLNYLSGLEGDVKNTASAQLGDNQSQYDRYLAQVPGEQKLLTQGIDTSQQKLNDTGQSAYDQAVQAYNALNQQRNAKFGQGSSAGGAVGELAARQFFQGQGQIGAQQLQGQQGIEQERTRLANYVQQKKDNLLTAFNDAKTKINTELTNRLAEIAGRKADTEVNKTKDKLAALQQSIADSRQIAQAHDLFNQQIGAWALDNYAKATGTTFTPQQAINWINPTYTTQFSQNPAGASGNPLATAVGGAGQYVRDSFGNLIDPITGQKVG